MWVRRSECRAKGKVYKEPAEIEALFLLLRSGNCGIMMLVGGEYELAGDK